MHTPKASEAISPAKFFCAALELGEFEPDYLKKNILTTPIYKNESIMFYDVILLGKLDVDHSLKH